MSEQAPNQPMPPAPSGPAVAERPQRAPAKPKNLPPYRVLLHNDDENTFEHVIVSLVELTPLNLEKALDVATEAHEQGVSLVMVTHQERAELYRDQLQSKGLVSSIEPAE
jgi:ATP-dependent Clp protease adaptor protein ClpS